MFNIGSTSSVWQQTFETENSSIADRKVTWREVIDLTEPDFIQTFALGACYFASALLGIAPSLVIRHIIDDGLVGRHPFAIGSGALMLVAVAAASGALFVVQGEITATLTFQCLHKLRAKLIGHLQTMPLSFYIGEASSSVVSCVLGDIEELEHLIEGSISSIATVVTVSVTTLVALCILDLRLALAAMLTLPLVIVPLRMSTSKLKHLRLAARRANDDLYSATQEVLSFSGNLLAKVSCRELLNLDGLTNLSRTQAESNRKAARFSRIFLLITSISVVIGPSAVWYLGGMAIVHGALTIGTLTAFVANLGRLYGPISGLATLKVHLTNTAALFSRVFGYLDMPTERINTPGEPLSSIRITFSDVTVADSSKERLSKVSFEVGFGKTLALVGPSGAGKTTILRLALRLITPSGGEIRINDLPIASMEISQLRKNIGFVDQETYLFPGTVRDNIAYAKPDASLDEIVAAADVAQILDCIEALPQKFETVVGTRGHRLSGGERQRIAIARSVITKPSLLLLDEATSSLDVYNESLVQKALRSLSTSRTCIVAAHRLSTVAHADEILYLSEGRVLERGTHLELLNLNGSYAKAYREQLIEEKSTALNPTA